MKQQLCSALGWYAILFSLVAGPLPAIAEEKVFSTISNFDPPVGTDAAEPSLFALNDERILMSWTEPTADGYAVKVSTGSVEGWSEPRTVVDSGALFVNWADFPSVAAFGDGTLAAHWLKETGSGYDYDLKISLSQDGGETWLETLTPHRDGVSAQHGFATLLPIADDKMLAVWLDGRANGVEQARDQMQLRGTVIASDGTLADDMLMDMQTCSCCQTSAAIASGGAVLVAYRDRTDREIRDISVVRMVDGIWSAPISVHDDGWKISGCPVNGPAIDASGDTAVVAWFTEARNDRVVNVAFSLDAGLIFKTPIRVDIGNAIGRVDTVMLDDSSALVSWVEWTEAGEVLFVCRAVPEVGCGAPHPIMVNKAGASINFPRMVKNGDDIYIAWTQPGQNSSIRVVRARP